MSALIQILSLPGLSALMGIMAVVALLWYLGPLLVINGYAPFASEHNRVVAAIVILALFALYKLVKFLLARQRNRKMTQELAKSEDPAELQTKEEIATLNKIFNQALSELKKTPAGHGRGGLYQLPWYVIIGPPGSGKTTALVNSGLNFPLAKRLGSSKIKGVGGTRNCDWWFTDQAVLLDTAGRYTTQDSHEAVDSAAWQNFLKLLKKYRRRRPINGVIVALSIADLLSQNESGRGLHALAIRQRIQELYEQFGIQFPIYVLFTKVDLVAGCMEFFDDLGGEERAQVWGMSFPLDEGGEESEAAIGQFSTEFELLEQRLNQRLLKRLQEERDPQRRDLIYAFPQQFNALKAVAQDFLDELFQPSRFEQRALVRGVYFTSGTQEGHPIDRLMGALATTFGVARQSLASFSGQGRSYFLTRLFRDVVFRESGLAGTNFRVERRRLWLVRAAYALLALVTVGLSAAWFTSYAANQSYVDQTDQQLTALRQAAAKLDPAQRSLTAVLPVLDQARAIPGATGTPAEPGWSHHLGLYQGDKLATSAATAYSNLLDRAFLSRLMVYIEARIKDQLRRQKPDQQALYGALKAYLMLDRSQPGRSFDPAFLQNWLTQSWHEDTHLSDEQRQHLALHLASLLKQLPDTLPLVPDQSLIRKARAALPGNLSAAQLYQQLRQRDYGIADFQVSSAAGPDAAAVFYRLSGAPLNSGVPGIFSKPGQVVFINTVQQRIKELAGGDWVLGLAPLPQAELQQRSARIQELYWRDYCPQWQKLLDDLDLRPPNNTLESAIDRLHTLAGPNSPLRSLLQAVAEQTAQVPQCLETLDKYVQGSPSELDKLLKSLDELAVQLTPLAKAKAAGLNLDRQAADKVLALIDALPQGKPAPLDRWLRDLTEPIPIFLYQGLRAYINNVWRSNVLSFCERALSHRFPFVPSSQQEVSLQDFTRLFGPGGLLDDFIHQGDHRFTAFVDTSKTPWQWRSFDNNPGIPSSKLAVLQLGSEIGQAFFPAGSQAPEVGFQLQLDGGDPRIGRVLLQLNGQTVSFTPGIGGAANLRWPGPTSTGGARLEVFPNDSAQPEALAASGVWGWFRLLEQAQLQQQASDRFEADFNVDGYSVRFALHAASVDNPFRLRLERFRCLRTL